VGGTLAGDVILVSGGNLVVNGVGHSLTVATEVRIWANGGDDGIDLSGLQCPHSSMVAKATTR
jgi:hypothetical protein